MILDGLIHVWLLARVNKLHVVSRLTQSFRMATGFQKTVSSGEKVLFKLLHESGLLRSHKLQQVTRPSPDLRGEMEILSLDNRCYKMLKPFVSTLSLYSTRMSRFYKVVPLFM